MRTIGVITVGRSDYSGLLPVLHALREDGWFRLQLIVAASHLSPEFGRTIEAIETDGFEIADRVEMTLSSDSPTGVAKSMGLGMIGFADVYARRRPDLLLVLGDRFEMHAAALAALPFKLPVAHIHGGEITEGAIDDALRHSITKLSHLHFVATEEYGRRVRQLGEEAWRVIVSGAPSVDALRATKLLNRDDLASRLELPLPSPPLLVTYHPVTLEFEQTEWQVRELLAAVAGFGGPIVFTGPNPDTAGRTIERMLVEFAGTRSSARVVPSLGPQAYFSLMAEAAAMVGNSSSGLIEAPCFELPVVNVGRRQAGRVRAQNVIDVGYGREDIRAGIERALAPDFRRRLRGLRNPYGDGQAAQVIVKYLRSIDLDERLVMKRFVDAPGA